MPIAAFIDSRSSAYDGTDEHNIIGISLDKVA